MAFANAHNIEETGSTLRCGPLEFHVQAGKLPKQPDGFAVALLPSLRFRYSAHNRSFALPRGFEAYIRKRTTWIWHLDFAFIIWRIDFSIFKK